ncbi:MAG: NRDE family protein [Bacteroidota bacterium]
MCTVTFLPFKNGSGYMLTSSRDEKVIRPNAINPQKYSLYGQTVFFPKDKQAGGTWVATSPNNFTLCLLNGAFVKHESKPPYRLSRGIMLLDFFKFNNVRDFINFYDFNGIENFTLLIIDSNQTLLLHELRWDGTTMHYALKDSSQTHIWSSATLYTDEAIKNRQVWFDEFIHSHTDDWSKEAIIQFHKSAGDGSLENSILMNRDNRVKTVSITCIEHTNQNYTMQYVDTENMETASLRIFKHEMH